MSKMSHIVPNHQKKEIRKIFDVCMALSCCIWPNITPDSDLKPLPNQLKSFKNLFSCYCNMDVFKDITWQAHSDGFIDIAHYANCYFSLTDCNLLELWSKLMIIGKNKPSWKGASLIVEICLCASFSNATLERFFSPMNIIKFKTRNRLSQSSLNAVLCIHTFSMPLAEFSQTSVEDCVTYWYNAKELRLGQQNKKHIVNKSQLWKSVKPLISESFYLKV